MPRSLSAPRAVVLVSVLFLVACNATTSPENGTVDGLGVSGAGSSPPAAGGSSSAGSGSEGGSAAGGSTSGTGGLLPSAGTSAAAGGATAGTGGTSAGGGGTGGGDPGAEVDPDIIFNAHFTGATVGLYARDQVAADFGAAPTWDNGLGDGRAAITEEDGNKLLRVTFPGGVYGPADGGVQFVIDLGGPHEELYFAYRIRFQEGFAFNMGGKLPGFSGGSRPSGCSPDEGGFSARNMWRNGNGAIVQYVYWPDQPNTCGDDLYYDSGGDDVLFTPGSWQTIEHRIRMNTPGQNDGVLDCWVDGESVWSESDRQWRKTDAFAIDGMFFSTFFGGGSQPWASPKEQTVDFDDLIVSKVPITH